MVLFLIYIEWKFWLFKTIFIQVTIIVNRSFDILLLFTFNHYKFARFCLKIVTFIFTFFTYCSTLAGTGFYPRRPILVIYFLSMNRQFLLKEQGDNNLD